MADIVPLRPAWAWDCPECGKQNFSAAVVMELTAQERQESLRESGWQEEEGDFLTEPETVGCGHCGAQFETEKEVEL